MCWPVVARPWYNELQGQREVRTLDLREQGPTTVTRSRGVGAFAVLMVAVLAAYASVAAVGLSELVCETPQAYADLVCELAGQPERRAQLRRRLGQARDDSPLYDAKGFAHDLEALYERMWARHEDGLPPAALPATQSEMESAR